MEFKEPDALFLSICAGQYDTTGRRFTIRGVGEMLRRYSNRAKLPYLNAHSFRHHMGHHIIQSGGSSADVMNILGHASVQSSTIYTMMTDHELEKRYRGFMNDTPTKERVEKVLRIENSVEKFARPVVPLPD